MSWSGQSFISAMKSPVKLGYLLHILRTRSLRSCAKIFLFKSPEPTLSLLRDLLLLREPERCRSLKTGFAGDGAGLAESVLKDLRKASISSRVFPCPSKCRSSHACRSCGAESASQRRSCRRRERTARSRAPLSWTSGRGMPRVTHSLHRSSPFIFSQLKSCFSCRRREFLSPWLSTVRPRFRHSVRRSCADKLSQRLACMRLWRSSCFSVPPKMPLRSASALSSSSDQHAHRSSSDMSSCEAFWASVDFASAMMSSVRPFRSSESCKARPCSVRRAILRQEPLPESLTTSFFMSRMQASPGTEIWRSSCVTACLSLTSTSKVFALSSSGCDST
mmetsp:Transcript_35020/g.100560  ORF Transcript_35020/g.100560 Transcript_35020/m.100560 type:complete len:334 (-) Transcript_35020:1354-2355(-)